MDVREKWMMITFTVPEENGKKVMSDGLLQSFMPVSGKWDQQCQQV